MIYIYIYIYIYVYKMAPGSNQKTWYIFRGNSGMQGPQAQRSRSFLQNGSRPVKIVGSFSRVT